MRIAIIKPITGILTILLFAITATAHNNPVLKVERGVDERVEELLKKMTLEEKIGQMNQYTSDWVTTGPITKDGDKQNKIRQGMVGSMLNVKGVAHTRALQEMALESRLGIPMLFALDVIHGYRTIFPIPLAEAASWDLEYIKRSAQIAAQEASAAGIHWTFAPMVDIARDARWGRIMEGAGEDTYLGSLIAEARVKGFQGNLGDKGTLMACAKHFAAYGAAEGGRDYNTVDMSYRRLHETYLPPFKAAVDAGVATFMNSFNDINGIPATGHSYIQRDILMGRWNFGGVMVSDWGSIGEMIAHGYAKDGKHAAMLAANAGSHIDMESRCYINHLKELVAEGKVKMEVIDDAVRRILKKKFEMGLFDDPFKFCDTVAEQRQWNNKENLLFAREMAKRSIVLLKNNSQILPLRSSAELRAELRANSNANSNAELRANSNANSNAELRANSSANSSAGLRANSNAGLRANSNANSNAELRANSSANSSAGLRANIAPQQRIALIGPLSKAVRDNLGAWSFSWDDDSTRISTIYQGIKDKVGASNLLYAKGCEIKGEDRSGFKEAIRTAKKADVIIVAVGESSDMSGEAKSRSNITLPGVQEELVMELIKTGKPVIVLIGAGRPLVFDRIAERADAILYTWWLGTEAGNAIADVLFGQYNPSAKLPVTFPQNVGQIPIYYNHLNTGRPVVDQKDYVYKSAYTDITTYPKYPFGYGLSYTTFHYSPTLLKTHKNIAGRSANASGSANYTAEAFDCDTLYITTKITNTGKYYGEEIVQLYIRDITASVSRPVKELKGFKKIALNPGETKEVQFKITPEQLRFYDANLNFIWEEGEFDIMVGASSEEVQTHRIYWHRNLHAGNECSEHGGLNADNECSEHGGLNAGNECSEHGGLNAGNECSEHGGLNADNERSGLNAGNECSEHGGLNAGNERGGLNAGNERGGLNAGNERSGLNAGNERGGLNAGNECSENGGLHSGNERGGLNAGNECSEHGGLNARWRLVWSDEFDYHGLPDTSKWNFDTAGNSWGWGNNEAQFYTSHNTSNALVDNGLLTITAHHLPLLKSENGGKSYTSARLTTKGKGDWLYGRFEIRAKVPAGVGTWPAIWMLPTANKYGGWPKSGEIDIMESVGYEPEIIWGSAHTEAYNHVINTHKNGSVKVEGAHENFHTYILEWYPDRYEIYVDKTHIFTFINESQTRTGNAGNESHARTSNADNESHARTGNAGNESHALNNSAVWPFDQPFHLILNLAIGGNWGGQKGIDNSLFPHKLEIDYVRVYQKR